MESGRRVIVVEGYVLVGTVRKEGVSSFEKGGGCRKE
jgi:hypothetical protein